MLTYVLKFKLINLIEISFFNLIMDVSCFNANSLSNVSE